LPHPSLTALPPDMLPIRRVLLATAFAGAWPPLAAGAEVTAGSAAAPQAPALRGGGGAALGTSARNTAANWTLVQVDPPAAGEGEVEAQAAGKGEVDAQAAGKGGVDAQGTCPFATCDTAPYFCSPPLKCLGGCCRYEGDVQYKADAQAAAPQALALRAGGGAAVGTSARGIAANWTHVQVDARAADKYEVAAQAAGKGEVDAQAAGKGEVDAQAAGTGEVDAQAAGKGGFDAQTAGKGEADAQGTCPYGSCTQFTDCRIPPFLCLQGCCIIA